MMFYYLSRYCDYDRIYSTKHAHTIQRYTIYCYLFIYEVLRWKVGNFYDFLKIKLKLFFQVSFFLVSF